jgi:hypothetical protein
MATQAGMEVRNGRLEWTAATAEYAIETSGYVVDIGQVTPVAKKWLDQQVKAGELVKYRGYWNTLSRAHGMGPLKTIYAIVDPEAVIAAQSDRVAA